MLCSPSGQVWAGTAQVGPVMSNSSPLEVPHKESQADGFGEASWQATGGRLPHDTCEDEQWGQWHGGRGSKGVR